MTNAAWLATPSVRVNPSIQEGFGRDRCFWILLGISHSGVENALGPLQIYPTLGPGDVVRPDVHARLPMLQPRGLALVTSLHGRPDRGHLTKRKKSYANGAVLKLVAFRFPPASPID